MKKSEKYIFKTNNYIKKIINFSEQNEVLQTLESSSRKFK